MIPPAFEYLRPKTIPEAIAFLQQYGDDAKILSGGQSLIPMMKFRLARPGYLIDINRISGLVLHQGRGRVFENRRPHARSRTGKLPPHSREISHPLRHCPRDRRPASAEHGNPGRQPGPRRSGERPSGYHAGAWERRSWPWGHRASECCPSRASLSPSSPPNFSMTRS